MARSGRLTKRAQLFVLERLAEQDTGKEIVQALLEEEFNVKVDLSLIGYYRKKHQAEILRIREQIAQDFQNRYPCSRIEYRLKRLQRIIDNPKTNAATQLKALKQAREETEPLQVKAEANRNSEERNIFRNVPDEELEAITKQLEALKQKYNPQPVTERSQPTLLTGT